jgi:hypothetical protein
MSLFGIKDLAKLSFAARSPLKQQLRQKVAQKVAHFRGYGQVHYECFF